MLAVIDTCRSNFISGWVNIDEVRKLGFSIDDLSVVLQVKGPLQSDIRLPAPIDKSRPDLAELMPESDWQRAGFELHLPYGFTLTDRWDCSVYLLPIDELIPIWHDIEVDLSAYPSSDIWRQLIPDYELLLGAMRLANNPGLAALLWPIYTLAPEDFQGALIDRQMLRFIADGDDARVYTAFDRVLKAGVDIKPFLSKLFDPAWVCLNGVRVDDNQNVLLEYLRHKRPRPSPSRAVEVAMRKLGIAGDYLDCADDLTAGGTPVWQAISDFLADSANSEIGQGDVFDTGRYVTRNAEFEPSLATQHFFGYGMFEGQDFWSVDVPRKELLALHQIDGRVPKSVDNVPVRHYGKDFITLYLAVVARRVREAGYKRIGSLIFAPWIKMGGADLSTISFANAYAEIFSKRDPDAAVVIVLTDDHDEYSHKFGLDDRVVIVDLVAWKRWAVSQLDTTAKRRLIENLIVDAAPMVTHIINSDSALYVATSRAKWVNASTKLVTNAFCYDIDDDGGHTGYIRKYVGPNINVFDLVHTDNAAIIDEMCERERLDSEDREKIRCIYHPNVREVPELLDNATADKTPKILWCGRFDRQKRLDILLLIAAQMPNVEFWCYGRAVVHDTAATGADVAAMIQMCPDNVRILPPVEHPSELPLPQFSGFVLTSEWEGLPNILLEIAASGLPIVAADVGGVGELVDDTTGWTVENWRDVDAYVRQLKGVLASSDDERNAKRQAMQQRLQERHGWDRFVSSVEDMLDQIEVFSSVEAVRGFGESAQPQLLNATTADANSIELKVQYSGTGAAVTNGAGTTRLLTVGMTAHREGRLALFTLASIEQALASFDVDEVELIVTLDRADARTREVVTEGVAKIAAASRIVELDVGDLGAARNTIVDLAHGRAVAFVDADDLIGQTWLRSAVDLFEKSEESAVFHPEYNVMFGDAETYVFPHVGTGSLFFDIADLFEANPWTALCLAPRTLLQTHPYRTTSTDGLYGYEDWSWHIDLMRHGYQHIVVPGTVHAIRRRFDSLQEQLKWRHCVPTRGVFDAIISDGDLPTPVPGQPALTS